MSLLRCIFMYSKLFRYILFATFYDSKIISVISRQLIFDKHEQMHSRLAAVEEMFNVFGYGIDIKQDFNHEEYTHPFTPVRKRKAPRPPPRVVVNEEYENQLLFSQNKEEKPRLIIKKMPVKNKGEKKSAKHKQSKKTQRRKKITKRNKMDDFYHTKGNSNHDFICKRESEMFMSSEAHNYDLMDFSKDLLKHMDETKMNNQCKNRK